MRITRIGIWISMWLLADSAPAAAQPTFSHMVARLEVVEMTDGSKTVSLLAGGPLGLGGTAAGRVTEGSTSESIWLAGEGDVSGIEPSPFFPAGEGDTSGIDPSPFAPEDAVVIAFHFDTAGGFSGVEPSPFKIYVATPSGYLGQLDFENATAMTGSLILTGVAIDTGTSTEIIPAFGISGVGSAVVPALGPTFLAVLSMLMLGVGSVAVSRRFRLRQDGGRRPTRRPASGRS